MKGKVEIEKVLSHKKNGVAPTLLKSQNGKLTAFTKQNTRFYRLQCKQDNTKLGALLVANGQTYQGLINDNEASELTDTYVCVRNKITNKMTLIPLDQVTLKNSIYDDLEYRGQDLSSEITKLTLLKKFGGRRASRFIKDQETMRMNINIVKNDLEATVQDSNLHEKDVDDKVDNTDYFDKIRPKFNVEAETLNEVYKVEDVVPKQLLDRLDEEAKTVYQTQIDKIPIQSVFLKSVLEAIKQKSINTESLLRIKIIIYMDSLLNVIKSRVKSLKKTELSQISAKVENDIRDRFSDPNSYSFSRTAYSLEKALCHFIVLSLLIDDKYQVNTATLSQELNAPRKKLLQYAHVVQALPQSKASILALKLPKDVPPLPTNFIRKKRQ